MLMMIASNARRGNAARFCVGELAGRLAGAGVKVDRAAARLRARHEDVAAVLLQHAGGGPVDVAEHGVADAAGEQRHRRPPPADRRQELGQRPFVAPRRRQHVDHPPQLRRQQSRQPRRLQQLQQAGPLRDPRRAAAPAAASRHTETGRTESSGETSRRLRDCAVGRCPSPRGTARSACRTARRRGRPFRRPGNRGTAPDGRARGRSAPACRRSRRASDRCGRAGCRSRRPFRRTSGTPPCTARSGRSRGTARSRAGAGIGGLMFVLMIGHDSISPQRHRGHRGRRIEQMTMSLNCNSDF